MILPAGPAVYLRRPARAAQAVRSARFFEGLAMGHARSRSVSVTEVCDRAPLTLTADASLSSAVAALVDADASCALILDERGRLSGLVTERDLLRALRR